MSIDKVSFYACIRTKGLFKTLSQEQVDSLDTVLNTWDKSGYKDLRWLAYMLATIKHETANTMLPIEEYGKGKSRTYGKKIKHSGEPYTKPDQIYYGRGFVQLTWYENYELMGRLLKIGLLEHPELALLSDIATRIMFEGMTKGSSSFGDFTGKCLEQYFNSDKEDWVNARKIINGLDKAEQIAEYAKKFYSCLSQT